MANSPAKPRLATSEVAPLVGEGVETASTPVEAAADALVAGRPVGTEGIETDAPAATSETADCPVL